MACRSDIDNTPTRQIARRQATQNNRDCRALMTASSRASSVPKGDSFHPSQSSLVFINCCFALSLTGILLLINYALSEDAEHLDLLWWAPLATYDTFIVWR